MSPARLDSARRLRALALPVSVLSLLGACIDDSDAQPLSNEVAEVTARVAALAPNTLPAYDETGCLGPGCSGGLTDDEFEYVIVGAGAGGGPLAANLARKGHRVLLLEAGNDVGDRLTYQIPAWHALASEDPAMRWDFFVKHYDDAAQAARDEKLVKNPDGTAKGIWYPRGSGVGGSTTMHAMITVAPHASDWQRIADTVSTEDPQRSWQPSAMRRFFERAEKNGYLPGGAAGHGFSGWMPVEAHPDNLFDWLWSAADFKMLRVLVATIVQAATETGGGGPIGDASRILESLGADINSPDPGRDSREGAFRMPQQTVNGRRSGVREYILDTITGGYPLTLKTRALVANVDFDRSGTVPRATGVQWIDSPHAYDASPRTNPSQPGTARSIRVTREVVLSAGAFNTPQLLMLSGIGPKAQLERLGIESMIDLPGVGANLQDRYEVGVVGEMSSMFGDDFLLLKDCKFDPSKSPEELDHTDSCYVLWRHNAGVYKINGAIVGVVKKSDPRLADPDLFIFGLPGYFKGYWPGYGAWTVKNRRYYTWVVLKAHTSNTDGSVTLKSADPRERPDVDFSYFGADGDADLNGLVEGVQFARRMVDRTKSMSPFTDDFKEVYPGRQVQTREQVAQFIKDKAWGHHACCTAKIGAASDPMAVLDGEFRVRGTQGLRVVDASAFPRIPGFFLTVPIYMISEKASDVIHAAAR